MKKTILNKNKYILIFLITIIMLSSFFGINTKKINAQIPPVVNDPVNTSVSIFKKIQDAVNHVQDYVVLAQQLANSYQSAKALVQQVTNLNLTNTAVNISSDQILTYGQTALKVLAGDQGTSTNVNTNGNQIVTSLKNFTDKVGVNEIRKALEDFKDPSNATPFSSQLKSALVDFTKNISDTETGKLVNFSLPYIARSEICNDTNLKNIIKNGEPADYVNAKKAVANVDIDKACQSPNIMLGKDQAIFVSLAKAGYGGIKTEQALADPNNTPSGVIANTISKVANLKDAAETIATQQTTATNLVIGQQSCFDKNGKLVNYDPASTKSTDKICYSTNSTPDQSGAIVKDRNAAALLSPYISMLARSIATTNQTGNCNLGPSEEKQRRNQVKAPAKSIPISNGPTINPPKTLQPRNTPNTGYENIFNRIFTSIFTTASAQNLSGVSKTLSGITKTINNASNCISLGSQIMNTIVGVLNIGGSNATKALSGEDNPYSRLSDSFDSILNSQDSQNNLYADAFQSQQEYEKGNTGYTIDDLKNTLTTYKNIRQINTDKLNDMLFTYAFVNLAIANSKASLPSQGSCSGFLSLNCKAKKANIKTIANIKDSVTGLQEAIISLNNNIKSLIKEMAKNNYKEQQIAKLNDEFQNTDTKVEDNQDALASVLDDAYTDNDYANFNLDWNYTPKFQDSSTDPSTITPISDDLSAKAKAQEQARQTKALIPPQVEKEGPYSMNNLDNLRLRAWKIFQRYINAATDNTSWFLNFLNQNPCFTNSSTLTQAMNCNTKDAIPQTKIKEISDLLSRYGMSQVKYLDPNIPRAGKTNVINVLTPDQSETWSELSFCNNLGIATTICDASNGINLFKDYTETLNDGTLTGDQLDNLCLKVHQDVNQVVEEQCSTTNDPDLLNQCSNQKPLLIQQAEDNCVDTDTGTTSTTSTVATP